MGCSKVLSQVLIHLNDQPVRPVAPNARLGTPTHVETANTTKVWKSWETVPTLTMDQHAMLLRTLSPIMPGKGVIYWNVHMGPPTRVGELLQSPG